MGDSGKIALEHIPWQKSTQRLDVAELTSAEVRRSLLDSSVLGALPIGIPYGLEKTFMK